MLDNLIEYSYIEDAKSGNMFRYNTTELYTTTFNKIPNFRECINSMLNVLLLCSMIIIVDILLFLIVACITEFTRKTIRQQFHIVADFLVIDSGVTLGSLDIAMPHHSADAFNRNSLREA